ncbi:MAG: hypothetical protein HKL96_06280 [Phycisphaerales bacterium]|nr:hypothetical protein [Phycisphaerales bacterium]
MRRYIFWPISVMLAAALMLPIHSYSAAPKPITPQLWLYDATNLLPSANVAATRSLWHRAAMCGYNHILLSDSKLAHLHWLGPMRAIYQRHVRALLAYAATVHLKVVPSVCEIGYSNDLLFGDPTAAEGLPVRHVAFVVNGQIGRVKPDSSDELPAVPQWHDAVVQVYNRHATISNNRGNARMVFDKLLQRWHVYHVSFFVRTHNYTGHPKLRVFTRAMMNLQYERLDIKATQAWRRYDVVFDTLNHRHVKLYFGVWGSHTGLLQLKDWHMQLAGLVNSLSRPGAPTTVLGLVAGRDYVPVVDPNLGNHPWPGEYQSWHKPVDLHFLKPLPNGTVVYVSWYYPPIVYDGQVAACIGSHAFWRLARREATSVRNLFHAHAYMLAIDECRVLDWDPSCVARRQSPGQLLAWATRRYSKLLGNSALYTWSDMFDPYHNAHDHYYLVNGSYADSWCGLSHRIIIMNWNYGQRDKSLAFFADRGYRQIIAAYYDQPLSATAAWIKSANQFGGVMGFMYTTWQGNYREIKPFAQMVQQKAHLQSPRGAKP